MTAGTISGLILFSWMISSAPLYTGKNILTGVPFWLVCSAYYGVITGISLKIIRLLLFDERKKHFWWINALLAGSVWIVIDYIRFKLFPGIPWINHSLALTQSNFILPLQILSITGHLGLNFLIIVVNVLLTYVIITRKYLHIGVPVSLYLALLILGYIRLNTGSDQNKKPVRVALICTNTEALKRWQPATGDSLSSICFNLNRQAVRAKPQMIIWSEGAIPWNFSTGDDLITKSLSVTWPSRAAHVIGIYSSHETDKEKSYNSAYYIKPDGAITDRYDKVQLLSFLEKPIGKTQMSFFKDDYKGVIAGKKNRLLKTDFGNAGVLICNEILAHDRFRQVIKKNARFFIIMSNNAWFEGTSLQSFHFNSIRIRAIEAGKDMIINCNRGTSGIIGAKGEIREINKELQPNVLSGEIFPSASRTFYAGYGDWIIVFTIILIILFLIINHLNFTKNL